MLLAALGFARGIGENALWLGLADAFAGVGLDGFDGGEDSFFSAFLWHLWCTIAATVDLCVLQIQIGLRFSSTDGTWMPSDCPTK